jgi:ATP-binding cassette subfamily B protein
MTLQFYSFFIFNPLQEMGNVILSCREAEASLEQFKIILAKPVEVKPTAPLHLCNLEELAFEKVSFKHRSAQTKALNEVSFSVKRGETIAFVGPSGSGKTTLAKILTGLELSDEGQVVFNGESILQKRPTGIQMVFQDPFSSLNTELTNRETVLEVLKLNGKAIEEAERKVQQLFNQVGLDTMLLDKYPHQLSGGQRQRLCIARALAGNPQVLVLDEAVAALDPLVQKQILDLLINIQEKTGVIYIFITHNHEAAQYLCHQFVKLESGSVMESGKY